MKERSGDWTEAVVLILSGILGLSSLFMLTGQIFSEKIGGVVMCGACMLFLYGAWLTYKNVSPKTLKEFNKHYHHDPLGGGGWFN